MSDIGREDAVTRIWTDAPDKLFFHLQQSQFHLHKYNKLKNQYLILSDCIEFEMGKSQFISSAELNSD